MMRSNRPHTVLTTTPAYYCGVHSYTMKCMKSTVQGMVQQQFRADLTSNVEHPKVEAVRQQMLWRVARDLDEYDEAEAREFLAPQAEEVSWLLTQAVFADFLGANHVDKEQVWMVPGGDRGGFIKGPSWARDADTAQRRERAVADAVAVGQCLRRTGFDEVLNGVLEQFVGEYEDMAQQTTMSDKVTKKRSVKKATVDALVEAVREQKAAFRKQLK